MHVCLEELLRATAGLDDNQVVYPQAGRLREAGLVIPEELQDHQACAVRVGDVRALVPAEAPAAADPQVERVLDEETGPGGDWTPADC